MTQVTSNPGSDPLTGEGEPGSAACLLRGTAPLTLPAGPPARTLQVRVCRSHFSPPDSGGRKGRKRT